MRSRGYRRCSLLEPLPSELENRKHAKKGVIVHVFTIRQNIIAPRCALTSGSRRRRNCTWCEPAGSRCCSTWRRNDRRRAEPCSKNRREAITAGPSYLHLKLPAGAGAWFCEIRTCGYRPCRRGISGRRKRACPAKTGNPLPGCLDPQKAWKICLVGGQARPENTPPLRTLCCLRVSTVCDICQPSP